MRVGLECPAGNLFYPGGNSNTSKENKPMMRQGFAVLAVFALATHAAFGGESLSLPFSVSVSNVTKPGLPEYLDNINRVTQSICLFQDWPITTAVIDGEFWVFNCCGGSTEIIRHKGTNIESGVRQADGHFNWTNAKWGTVQAPYILGGVWYDSSTHTLYAPLHCEYGSAYGGRGGIGATLNRQIHLATSTDKGLTWNYEGPIITRDDPGNPRPEDEYSGSHWDGGEGDFYLYADEKGGYVYVYSTHNLWPKPETGGQRFWGIHVSRCAISDHLAPGKWKKFYRGTWDEPGLGGKASFVDACNVIYSSHLKKYVSFNFGGGLSVCTDLSKQDWSGSYRISGGNWGCNDIWAWTPVDVGKIDVRTFDRSMYVYSYWHDKHGSAYKVDFDGDKPMDVPGYVGAGVDTPLFAHTLNPIRVYENPLYDSDDPIASRHVRAVSCLSPETVYSGKWTNQSSPVAARISGAAKNSISLVFKGSGIYWRAASGPDCGKADVYLDGAWQQTVDFYGDYTPLQFWFIKTGLATKRAHRIRIVARGEKNTLSSGTAIKHMSFEVAGESDQASDGFCSVQGKNNWYYQAWDGSNHANLEFDCGKNIWTKHGGLIAIGPGCQTPDEAGAVRKWVAPRDGKIRLEGQVEVEQAGGNGIYAQILKNAAAVWPERLVTCGKKESHDKTISVKTGDSVCFTVKRNGEQPAGKTFWDPVITYVDTKKTAK
jgi:hypothetical protein